MIDWFRENDIGEIIAPWIFIGLMESQAICFGIVTKLSWWIVSLICIGVFIVVLLYRPLFEYVMVLPTLGMIGFLVYSIFNDEISLPTGWMVFIIVWVVIYILYMIFLSTFREHIDERRYGRW